MNYRFTKVLCGVFAVLAVTSFCFALIASQRASAAEPKLKPHTAELRKADFDARKPQLATDEAGKKDFEMKKLSDQVYRIDVKATAEGLEEYEAALVLFCKEHSDSSVCQSPAPVNLKGNTGSNVWYWTISKKQ